VGEEGKARAYEAAGVLKRKGADVIALSCTGYSTIGIAPELERRTGILVIDPIIASGLFAWHAATRLK
jgi:allantoin racemase